MATRCHDSLKVDEDAAMLPPKFQAEKIDGAVSENPPERARFDVNLAEAAHAGAPPGLNSVFEAAAK